MRDWLKPVAPSHTSTIATDGHSRSMARASSIVRFGRRATSRKLLPEPKLRAPHFCTIRVFGPSCLNKSRKDWSKPRMSDVIPTIDVMPMTTPRTVSAERILLARSVSKDMTTISESRPVRTVFMLFAPQGFDRIQFRRAHRGIQTKEQSDERGNADAHRHGPRLDRGRKRRQLADDHRKDETKAGAEHAAERRKRDRLRQDLPDDVAAARAEGLSQPDLARALAHHHQHDVHDHDAADDERQRHDADEHGEDALGGGLIDAKQRVRREHAEVVALGRSQPPLDP